MELEKQVVSLDLAKRLKELGVKQESLYHWWGNVVYNSYTNPASAKDENGFSAFTVAELGDMLPKGIQFETPFTVTIESYKSLLGKWLVGKKHDKTFEAETEADARAKTLIYLIENDLYKPTH